MIFTSLPANIGGGICIVLMLLCLRNYSLKELRQMIPLDGSSWILLRLTIKVKEIREDIRRAG